MSDARLSPVLPRRGPRTSGRRVVLALFGAICLAAAGHLHAAEETFILVVHPSVQETSLDRAFVADAFLKKRTRWSNGDQLRPVDQHRDAAVRHHFSEEIIKRSVEAVRNYWQQRIFSGRDVPPPEVRSDAAVLQFVRENPGAIGYVSEVKEAQGVRVVGWK